MGSKMVEIKFLGSGGQGVVVATELLARACFEEGMYPQSYSLFGGERRGAPVAGFVRVSDTKIYLKCDVDRPDHLVLFDKSLYDEKEINAQVIRGGYVLFNCDRSFQPGTLTTYKVCLIDALEISREMGLGSIVNTAMLGAYIRLTGTVKLETLLKVIGETIFTAPEANIAAAKEAYEKATLL
jgi:2-oxoacid:acceptor oxidoreductase gamma subunit (pyruvate/2-ketoisovalerate family)